MTVLPLILRNARAFRGVLAVLALLVFVTAFVAAAAPAALTQVYDSAIHDLLERAPAEVKDVQVVAPNDGPVTIEAVSTQNGAHPLLEVEVGDDARSANPITIQVAAGTVIVVNVEMLASSTSAQSFVLNTSLSPP